MGVQGLWSILHSTGRDIDLSSLEGKVLAIDMSIWLNQALKSGIDSPNVHLEILFRRICKLLFYKIKPIFVFDGPSPSLKKEAILNRRKLRQLKQEKSEQIKSNIINLLMKKKLIEKQKNPKRNKSEADDDLFELTENEYYDSISMNKLETEFEISDIALDYLSNYSSMNEVNIESQEFQSLPLEVQHEVIRNIAKEKRYGYDTTQSSFLDKSGEEFSSLQIQRLLSRNTLQQKVEDLRTSMNYRNNQNIIGSLAKQQLNNLPATVNTRKVLSRDEGYLMMIDPSETDIVDTLTKLKAEYLFKKHDQNIDQNDHKTSDKDNDPKTNDSPTAPDVTYNKNTDSICDDELIQENQDLNKFHDNYCYSIINQSDLSNANPANEIGDMNKLCEVKNQTELDTSQTLDIRSNNNDNNCIDPNDSIKHTRNESCNNQSDEVASRNKPECDIYQTNLTDNDIHISTYINPSCLDIQINNSFSNSYENDTKNSINKSIDLDEIEEKNKSFLNSTECNKEENEEDEDDDDFVDVPEANVDEIEVEEINGFSDTDISMILSDPIQWQENIEETIANLYKEEHKIESQAASMSERYYQEAKDLLKLFGIPFIESPGEAEAQCAFLEKCNLTDGTITEDSDIWLFGGSMVYKHIFSRNFSARAYSLKQIFKLLGLSQDLMICIALLSGSDYAPGIYGIGPVIAMEILAEFSDPEVEQSHFQVLENFKLWHDKWSKIPVKYKENPNKKRFLRFHLDHNFLDQRIVEAYNSPLVNESKEPFIWSKPSIDKLLEFALTKIGWEHLKVIEMLNVVSKSNESKKTYCQKTILDYFTDSKVDELMNSKKSPSKRLRLATKQRNLISDNIKKVKK